MNLLNQNMQQFQKRSKVGGLGGPIKLLFKITFVLIVLLFIIVLVDKINFPYPNKKIEKVISNENLKIVK